MQIKYEILIVGNCIKSGIDLSTSEAELTCHLSSYFMVETNHNHLCLVTVFTIVFFVVVVVDDDNDDAFDCAVVLH